MQVLRQGVPQIRKLDQTPAHPHRRATVQVQVLRTIVQHLEQPATAREKHPRQAEAVQVSPVREMFRPADELGPASEEARGRRRERCRFRGRLAWEQQRERARGHLLRRDQVVHGQSDLRG